ncbi:MAG: hypothetical protein NZ561_11840 [Phycisphaerae bacterium]|nr:hypothetical protein [Phycisphaerae bacterium]
MPDVPEEVRRSLKFHFVDNVDEVLKVALSRPRRRGGSRRKVSGTSA